MENRSVKPGDQHHIKTLCYSGIGVVKRASGIQTNSQTGLLVDYEIEDYGETGPFFLPDDRILQERINGRMSRSLMPKEYVYKTARDFDWTQYGGEIGFQKKVANAFVINFSKFRNQGRGLYIYSSTKGTGKTMLSCCIANEVLKTHDISVKFISMAEYIELAREKGEGAKEKINSIMDAALLIVDDIGATTEDKDWISNVIFRLVNRRHENLLPTLYTSNVPIERLKSGDRVISRIYEDSIPIKMPEISVRAKKADESRAEFLNQVLGQEGI